MRSFIWNLFPAFVFGVCDPGLAHFINVKWIHMFFLIYGTLSVSV